ncbi:MAG TPA: iron-sulfur cluster repair di-iron protein [Sphingomicrobium sp.]|nr:iron-sulfur cluster repair di-iron protein [Sphingomicrobium sp.]
MMAQVAALEPLGHRKVGEIAANLAGATGVFRNFRIDFCCHGDVPLDEAAAARGIDPRAVEAALWELDGASPSDLPTDTAELIDHILERYHETHRRQLPELIQLSRRVEQVHAGKPGVPAGLADILHQALGELEVHMRKEELMIFPAMRRTDVARQLDGPTAMLREDHSDQGAMLEQISAMTDDFTVPEGACATWRALYAGAAEFKHDLVEHIHIENNILFPRFENSAIPA